MRRRKAKTTISPLRTSFPEDARYRIHWISKITGFTGHGSWISLDSASVNAAFANKDCREAFHWVETRGQDKANERLLKQYKELYPDTRQY